MPVIFILISILMVTMRGDAVQDVDRDEILGQLNALREAGCSCSGKKMPPVPLLIWSETLEKTAYMHAEDMDKRGYFSHVTPDGVDVGERVKTAGYNWSFVGENIAQGQHDFSQVLDDWIGSPVHCKLIMNPNFTETAVSRYGQIWVQHFGRKLE